ncbi:GNAT family N-acetyltransferase [Metabacillus litoralis]|uniref:GNAT family N-acetyltransferase n=1 Tax=Metabacillus litoralis TaxID=152268 RepID=A0A5C6W2I7_9BACI|nr:GNAT family protein [Metabacillus litoralis]TXC92083.1 GNAT family N-acetyltransferase [Metabacillus litoralis]
MIEILTNRLMIVPCSLDIAKSLVFHRKELEKRSPIEIPSYWPTSVVRGFIPYYIESMERMEKEEKDLDCGFWLIILYEQKKIIGDLLMKGKPEKEGEVELSYHIDGDNIDETIAYEAIDAFIDWLTYQQAVKKIIMECEVEHQQTIKLYNKLGFICKKKDGDFLTWEIQKKGE